IANERAHQVEGESLTADRGRLQCRLVVWNEAIHAGEHQGLDRSRHLVRLRAFFGMAQKLFQKERVSLGAIDAALEQSVVRDSQALPELGRFLRPQWAEIDRSESCAHGTAP